MKKIVSLFLLIAMSLTITTRAFASETNSKKEIKTKKSVQLKSRDFYYEDGVKVYVVYNSELLDYLTENGFDYTKEFSKEDLEKMKEEDALLKEKVKTSINVGVRKKINSEYSRVYIPISWMSKLAAFGLTGASIYKDKFGLSDKVAKLLGLSAIPIGLINIDYFSHIISTPYKDNFRQKIKTLILKPTNFEGWIHHTINHFNDNNNKRILATKWYYIGNGKIYGIVDGVWRTIDNKWYEFNEYGILKEYEGWRKYKGKWMYHIPGNYGAYKNESRVSINGEVFSFDTNGY